MKVLLIGPMRVYDIASAFKRALESLGHQYIALDEEASAIKIPALANKVLYRALGKKPVHYWAFNKEIVDVARRFNPQVVLILKGAFIAPDTLQTIRRDTQAFRINYMTDDPFNPAASTKNIVDTIPLWDVEACTKQAIVEDVRRAGEKCSVREIRTF